jgi:hypothetical protein
MLTEFRLKSTEKELGVNNRELTTILPGFPWAIAPAAGNSRPVECSFLLLRSDLLQSKRESSYGESGARYQGDGRAYNTGRSGLLHEK